MKSTKKSDTQNILVMLYDCLILAIRLREHKLRGFILPEGKLDLLPEEDGMMIKVGDITYEVTVKKKRKK